MVNYISKSDVLVGRVHTFYGRGGKEGNIYIHRDIYMYIHTPNYVSRSLYVLCSLLEWDYVASSIQPSLCLPVNLTVTFVTADVHSVQLLFNIMWHRDRSQNAEQAV